MQHEHLYIGCIGLALGRHGWKYGHTRNIKETIKRHKRAYGAFYDYTFIPLPCRDYQTARRYELLLEKTLYELGWHYGRVRYCGQPRTELFSLPGSVDIAFVIAMLQDIADWADEADAVV